ncbi:MAG TPA: alkaline phosphatase family protein [Steroidobacteraceae bacterium]|nr:alkaline phosphatase family protein [Steroidobacteraceae bacterium]
MRLNNHTAAISIAMSLAVSLSAISAQAHGIGQDDEIKRVLLISVDGLHALDVARYVDSHPHSTLTKLTKHGITYSNARTPANSDSFPGLLALVTGGSPVTSDLFYDVSYDRTYFANGDSTCAGTVNDTAPGAGQTAGKGSTIAFDETIDLYGTDPVSGLPLSKNVINPNSLPFRIDSNRKCVPVYPHEALKTNTIFEVVKEHGGVTAWADKHPAYDLVRGPSGAGVDDLYTPEVTNVGGLDNTVSVICTHENDHLKTIGIINQIHGLTHDGKPATGIPTVFGTDYQAVSVGQKVSHDTPDPTCINASTAADAARLSGQPGGYTDGSGTPTDVLAYALDAVDSDLQQIVDALEQRNLSESTLIIVTAKHGQSPINPVKIIKPGHFADLVAGLTPANSAESAAQKAVNIANNCASGPCGFAQDDDIALLWLQDQSQTANVASLINNHAKELFVDEVMAGDEIKLKFNDPMHNNRTPDIIVQPQYGIVYTTSTKKNAEHGGFSFGDTNVGLVVSNPDIPAQTVKTLVLSSQVAPTILWALGIEPKELKAVRVEGTRPLPGL